MSTELCHELILPRARLGELLAALVARGYRLIGPKLQDGAILYGDVRGPEDLPEGYTDEQAPGRYRVKRRADSKLFGYAVGPRSFRQFLQVTETELVTLRRGATGPSLSTGPRDERPLALFGARSCDLHAIYVQDRILMEGAYPEPRYSARRRGLFVVAVNCTEPSGTCFCVSMGTGPRAERGYDLSLTELVAGEHRFLVRAGSPKGAELCVELGLEPAADADRAEDGAACESARVAMGRSLEEHGVRELLRDNLEHPEWDAVAERCLACTNCTLVCPTCFCTTTEDRLDLSGETAERGLRHDSCFTTGHSHLHGGSVRSSIKSRYRQWLTHKFSTWYDQFGSSGCVGCGRCITFCPVGIDVTEEIARIRGDRHGV
jgi:sulfhydrogenase subunit beta (sulfur reductase)